MVLPLAVGTELMWPRKTLRHRPLRGQLSVPNDVSEALDNLIMLLIDVLDQSRDSLL